MLEELIRERGPRPLIIAHRGASAEAPENTLLAFALAVEQGADAIELDVHATCDGRAVVIHDARLERTTGERGEVGCLRWADLASINAGRGERVPLLSDALDLLRGRARVDVEIKTLAAVEPALEAIRRTCSERDVVLSSFSWRALLHAARHAPRIERALIQGTRTLRPNVRLREALPHAHLVGVGARALVTHQRLVHRPLLATLRALARRTLVWTTLEEDRIDASLVKTWARLVRFRVDGIVTSRPGDLRNWLADRAGNGCAAGSQVDTEGGR